LGWRQVWESPGAWAVADQTQAIRLRYGARNESCGSYPPLSASPTQCWGLQRDVFSMSRCSLKRYGCAGFPEIEWLWTRELFCSTPMTAKWRGARLLVRSVAPEVEMAER